MNIYRHTFTAVCPSDAEVIRVVHTKTATALIKQGWHEKIADDLAERLGGDQVIKAVH